jgi:hypothetical protein
MRLIQNEKSLRDLDEMLKRGTYQIVDVRQSSAGTDYYVIDAPSACSDVLAVPCHYRPRWGAQYYKKGGK